MFYVILPLLLGQSPLQLHEHPLHLLRVGATIDPALLLQNKTHPNQNQAQRKENSKWQNHYHMRASLVWKPPLAMHKCWHGFFIFLVKLRGRLMHYLLPGRVSPSRALLARLRPRFDALLWRARLLGRASTRPYTSLLHEGGDRGCKTYIILSHQRSPWDDWRHRRSAQI